jgi:Ca2+-binding EF-hand superfamily protein
MLLNKKSPADDSTIPFELFQHYSHKEFIEEVPGGPQTPILFVEDDDVPAILYGVFAGQEDEVRVDAAQLINKFKNQKMSDDLIEHLVDQVWVQYDYDHSGFLNEEQAHDFLFVVLQLNENMLAKSNERDSKDIQEELIKGSFDVVDANHDGKITKDELKTWLKSHLSKDESIHAETLNLVKQLSSNQKPQQPEEASTGNQPAPAHQ